MYFPNNVKILRQRLGLKQQEVADLLKTKRSTISGYENDVALPGIQMLIELSDFYKISIDILLRINLAELSDAQIDDLIEGFDIYTKGTKLRVLATTVDDNNEENIEVVSEKAKAGYKNGYSDPEFISELPKFHLPFLSKERKYRTFQINGDSMLPVPDKSFVTGEFVQDWNYIKTGTPCIVLTLDDGIVFKIIENNLKATKSFKLISFNEMYEPYDVHVSEIKEIWKFVNLISNEMPEKLSTNDKILNEIRDLKHDIKLLKNK